MSEPSTAELVERVRKVLLRNEIRRAQDAEARVRELEEALRYQVTYLTELAEMLSDSDAPLLGPLAAMFLGLPDAHRALGGEE